MSRTIRHWTPRYIVNRLLWEIHQRKHPTEPWLTSEACSFLSKWLKPTHVGIEWGSGRSTLWFSQRVKQLTSVEHNASWFEKVQQLFKEHDVKNVEYHFASLEQQADKPLPRYIEVGADLPQESLDFALVDGELRDLCIEAVMDKLKPGGLLVLDNAELFLPYPSHSPGAIANKQGAMTDRWKALNASLTTWQCTWTSSGVCDTALFIKPA